MPTQVSVHWLGYGALVAVIGFGAWLWRDTEARDARTAAAVLQARSDQAKVDALAVANTKQAQDDLKTKNQALQKQLVAAKTSQQQATLINAQAGTHIEVQPQAVNPSGIPEQQIATVPVADLATLATQTVNLREAQNQVAADQIQIDSDRQQIDARDATIADQKKEIVAAKGGGRVKRFFKATEHVAIGAAIGATITYIEIKK